jgi:hypothetical protein
LPVKKASFNEKFANATFKQFYRSINTYEHSSSSPVLYFRHQRPIANMKSIVKNTTTTKLQLNGTTIKATIAADLAMDLQLNVVVDYIKSLSLHSS